MGTIAPSLAVGLPSDSEARRFAWVHDRATVRGSAVWDQSVVSNGFFEVIPSKGSLCPGWLLIVPRRALFNLAQLNESESNALAALIGTLRDQLMVFEGEVFCFEHGATSAGSLIGCGVDQAHLHIVPLPFDLVSAASAIQEDDVDWCSVGVSDTLTRLPAVGDYVAVWRAADGVGAIGFFKRPVSQWMRRVIAQHLGVGSEWNYRTNPQRAIVEETLTRLRCVLPADTTTP